VPEWVSTLKITRRGFRPHATGKVYFQASPVKYVKAIDLTTRGPFKRIRGVCSGVKVAPNVLNRVVGKCREVFNDFIPDVWVHTDLQKSQKGVQSANGYAISLVAESTEKLLISVD
jgi:RNA 3'-terminal phosphate cyclase-like protein